MLQLKLLGGFTVEADGKNVGGAAAQPRRLALLALIARAGARGVSRELLQVLLWPDLDDERGRRVVTHALYALRRDLGADDAITGMKDLRLNRDVAACDLLDFEESLARAELERAVGIYGGPFLQGFRLPGAPEFERWADEQRTGLAHRYVEALEKLGRDATRRDNAGEAVQWWRRAAAQDPLNARFTVELMQALVAAGNTAGALKQAGIYEALIDEELGLPPDREVVDYAARIREEASRSTAAAAADSPAPGVDPESGAVAAAAAADSAGHETPTRRRRTKPALVATATVALIAFGIVIAVVLRRGASTSGPAETPVLVVGAIRDQRAAARDGLGTVTDLLATSLARVDGVRVISTARVYELLAQMGRDVERPTPADLAAVARVAGATELIDGAVYLLPGGALRLDLRRTKLPGGELIGSHTMVGANLFALVDSGTVRLARDAGSRPSGGSIADVTTTSEVAYRFYEEGLRHYFRNQLDRAAALFEAALREDSTFALAALYAGYANGPSDSNRARALMEQARRLAHRASDRERLSILAAFAFEAHDPSAIAIAETLAVRYPLEPEGHLYSGAALVRAGLHAQAIAPLLRVVRLDSLAVRGGQARCLACGALDILSFAYAALDSLPAALRVARRWRGLNPEATRAWLMIATHHVALGQFDAAAAALRRATELEPGLQNAVAHVADFWIRQDRPDVAEREIRRVGEAGELRQRVDRSWFLAITLREQGKHTGALAQARAARSLRVPPPDTLVLETVLLEAQVLVESGRAVQAAVLLDSLASLPLPHWWPSARASLSAWALAHRAAALFESGDTVGLTALADTIDEIAVRTLNRRFVPHYARGLLAYARRDYDAARRELERSLPSGLSRARYYLARAHMQAGQPRRAVPLLQAGLRAGIEGGNLYTTRTELHELLGQAWAAAGRADSAAAHFRVVARSWRTADPRLRARRDAAAAAR